MEMEELMMQKCLEWLDNCVTKENVSVVAEDDEGFWHRRVFLVVWNDDDGYTHTYIIRVWTVDEGENMNLSQDYEDCVEINDFVNTIPTIAEQINRVR